MALNALDLAVLEKDSLKKGIMFAMFKSALPSPMDFLGVENAQSLSQDVIRMTDPGTPSTRNLNDTVTAYQAQFTRGSETLKIIENKVVIDPTFLDVKTYVQDPVTTQTKAYAKVVRTTINDLFLNGDPGSDVTQPAGLDYRLRNDADFNGQAIDSTNIDVDGSDALRNQWLDQIDESIQQANSMANQIIVNKQTHLKLRSALRNLKILDTTKDQFDRKIFTYGDSKIIDAGQKPAGVITGAAADQVIGNDSTTGIFGDASSTPMYFVNTTGEESVKLLQLHSFRVKNLGINPNNPAEVIIQVKWVIGFLVPQKFSISSLDGLDIS